MFEFTTDGLCLKHSGLIFFYINWKSKHVNTIEANIVNLCTL